MKNLISLQSLQSYAFAFGLRGVYDACDEVINAVLDSNLTDELYSQANKQNTDAFQLWFDNNPDMSEKISRMAFNAIGVLSGQDMDKCLPFTCFKYKNLVKEISVLL